MDTFLEVIKWIGIALAAGFVGYFGRVPAKILIDKMKGEQKTISGDVATEGVDGKTADYKKDRLKIEKKRAKQTAKIAKKSARQ